MDACAAMYRPSAFAIDDIPVLHDVIRRRVFATIAAIVDGAVTFYLDGRSVTPSVVGLQ